MALKRDVSLFGAVSYGVGIILGAGIYALIGKTASIAGNSVWLSFLIAAIVASFSGLSYAELSSLFPKSSGEFAFVKEAFGKEIIAFFVGWLVVLTGVIAMSAVALSFAGYFSFWFGTPIVPVAVCLVLMLSIVNFMGIKESVRTNIVLTLIEALGLMIIILIGIGWYGKPDYLDMPHGISGVFSASALIFFAYIGFESIVKIAEELKNPARNLPKTIILSLLISSILYVAVAFSAVSILTPIELGKSDAPLANVASRVLGENWGLLLAAIALFATANTVLICNVTASRMFYGISTEGAFPKFLGRIHRGRRTPWIAIALSAIISILFILPGDLKLAAKVTDFGIFVTFIFVNLSLIQLRRKKPELKPMYRAPLNLKNFPIIALFGMISCLFLVSQFDWEVFAIGTVVTAIGMVIYTIHKRVQT